MPWIADVNRRGNETARADDPRTLDFDPRASFVALATRAWRTGGQRGRETGRARQVLGWMEMLVRDFKQSLAAITVFFRVIDLNCSIERHDTCDLHDHDAKTAKTLRDEAVPHDKFQLFCFCWFD